MSNTSNTTTTTTAQDVETITTALRSFHTDGDVGTLQAAYRAVHASRRGAVQAQALSAVLTDIGAETMGAALQAMADLPAATSSRTASRQVTDTEAEWMRNVILDHIGAFDLVDAADDEFLRGHISDTLTKVSAYIGKVSIGNSRTSHDAKPADVVTFDDDDDTVILTAKVNDNTVYADLLADNTVTIDGQSFPSVSAAAKSVVGRAQNGWTFWRFNGQTLASLRDS